MAAKPMLGDVELQLVQKIDTEGDQVLAEHGVPGLEGDFLQGLGRRAVRLTLNGVLTGPEAGKGLKTLREKFRAAEPISFVADIATATKVGKVFIEEMGVRDLAGKPERFEYAFALREFLAPPPADTEEPPPGPVEPEPPDLPSVETGTLIVEVIVEGQPDFDFSKVTLTVEGTQDDKKPLSRNLTKRENNIWTEDNMPPGRYTANAVVTDPPMTGSVEAQVRGGQKVQISITLNSVAVIAKSFMIHFRFDNGFVEPCMRAVLKQVAGYAGDHPTEKLLVVGHTDEVGSPGDLTASDPYNQSLSERRARSAFALLTFGLDATASMAEWNAIRQQQAGLPTLGDKWGARQYQYMLQDLGFYQANVDGIHGAITDDAVRAFRSDKGLPPGTSLDDAFWQALIADYLAQDILSVPPSQFLPNAADGCDGGILKWLGCASQDPVKNVRSAWRPNRRVELLFVNVSKLPCQEPQPDTFDLPAPGAVNPRWCLLPGDKSKRACFVVLHLPLGGQPKKDEWVRQPAEPGAVTVRGSIKFEDGTPAAKVKYVLIAPDGEFMDGEQASGEGIVGLTKTDGTFEYPDKPKGIGIYTMEIQGPFVARLKGEPIEKAKGNVICKRLDGTSDFEVIVVGAAVAKIKPSITLASPIVVVKKPHTNPARQAVTLKVDSAFSGSGILSRLNDNIHFFTAAFDGTEITFDGTDNVFTDAELFAGQTIFAEGFRASGALDDVALRLALTVSGQSGFSATATMTAVELTLDVALSRPTPTAAPPLLSPTDKIDVGRFLIVQDAIFAHERAMVIIQPPRPAISATLELTAVGGHTRAFAQEIPAAGQVPLATPHTILTSNIPVGGAPVFVEGSSASGALRDTEFHLGIQGLEPTADLVKITVFPDPSLPGPFAVGEHDYVLPTPFTVPTTTETISEQSHLDAPGFVSPATTTPFPVTLRALVRYPAQNAGVDTPVSTALANYPLVILAHGNHRPLLPSGARVENFRGLEYLARHFASYGYIAVSIDLNDMNIPFDRNPAIVQRGLTVLEHIRQWVTFNTSDPIFQGKVELDKIALVGHSRGGETVVSAHRTNVDQSRGHNVRAVISISPTDFLGITLPPTPYLVIYGSEDGDVSIGWPFRLYDRATPTRAMVFIYAAIHNFFQTEPDWFTPAAIDSTDPRRLLEIPHRNIAKGYCLGFLDMVIRNLGDHAHLFKRNGRPSTVPAAVELHHQVQDPTRLTVDNFEQGGAINRAAPLPPQLATRAGANTLGLGVTVSGLVSPTGLASPRTHASLQHRDIVPFWHDTVGGMVGWDAAGGTYTTAVGDRNVSAFAVLSVRVAQRFDSPRNPNPAGATTPGAAQDCTVTLVDSVGQSASVRLGTIAPIPFPYKRTTPALTKSALKTIRIPLNSFVIANGSLSLASIRSIRFEFGPAARGELAIDDIEFSN